MAPESGIDGPRTAILQDEEDSPCAYEMSLLRTGLSARGIAVRSMRRDDVEVDDIPEEALVAGEVDFVLRGMRRMGIAEPPLNDYPEAIQDLLHRRVWAADLEQLRSLANAGGLPVFAKPRGRRKLFRGRIFSRPESLDVVAELPAETPVWLSEVLPLVSEFRFYVIGTRIVCRENYDGDPADMVDDRVVQHAVMQLERGGESVAAYAIDFGLTRDGRTVLVEMNDGFSVGTYREISAADYTELTLRRWDELLRSRTKSSVPSSR